MCRWEPCESASSLVARTLLRICFKNNNRTAKFLAIHAASGHEVRCDGSFHGRHHMRLLQCAAVPSAPPHAARLLATRKLVYRMPDVLVLVAVYQQSEEDWHYGFHCGRSRLAP